VPGTHLSGCAVWSRSVLEARCEALVEILDPIRECVLLLPQPRLVARLPQRTEDLAPTIERLCVPVLEEPKWCSR